MTRWYCVSCDHGDNLSNGRQNHDDVIKWKQFPRCWPFVRGIHRSPVKSPPKGQWRGALMFSLICAWINGWANNREAGDLRRNRAHYDVIVMTKFNVAYQCSIKVEPLDPRCYWMYWKKIIVLYNRADYRLASSQWETSLLSNAVSHWLGANLESTLF